MTAETLPATIPKTHEKPINTFAGDGTKTVVTYKCKFCQKTGAIEVDDHPGIRFQVEKWQPALCCNRCGYYREARNGIRDRVQGVVEHLIQMKSLKALTQELETGIRAKLTDHTKNYARLINEHYRKVNVWDREFINILMDRPEMWPRILNDYEKRRERA